ncbi:MAG: phosphoesterase [Waddliaceae bacterium]|jgi:uncharacterized protein|nr:phosphoesterase [Waddliaceae bacterium]MBT3579142.1 phosphoesterase [Waddliaceae bacterium]MBT4444298.1 phosphoesterase [Waddliaceae bacterium]MBT6928513.1 phosphoesterase [Waddliaceae bacterium]MBT7264851.1 phosphoesterase [Waddliaceae bacterium]
MTIWALSDLHLAFEDADKKMDVFGGPWENYTDKIQERWRKNIGNDDLVLIAGDISWAMTLDAAAADLSWVGGLPGTKVIVRGNHDYWWSSMKKMKAVLPKSIHPIQNNAFDWGDVSITGTRLWDTTEFSFNDCISFVETEGINIGTSPSDKEQQEKIFSRELHRLELGLKAMNPAAKQRIVITHFPPIGPDLQDSSVSRLLEKYNVDICIFGHLHNVSTEKPLFGTKNEIQYIFTSCDHLDFTPTKVV